jgi:DNA-binding transcriptional regulator YhcF (GntR family)
VIERVTLPGMTHKYQQIADTLRARIQSGTYPVGSQLPGISALMEEFGVRGLNTIRYAEQSLVEEGMLETRQGVGAFVTSTQSLRQINPVELLTRARDGITTALTALKAQRSGMVTFDLDEEHVMFVLTSALREWATSTRSQAADEDPDTSGQADFLNEVADVADRLVEQIDAA